MLRGVGPRGRFVGARLVGARAAAFVFAVAAVGAISTLGMARGAPAESESKVRIACVGDYIADG